MGMIVIIVDEEQIGGDYNDNADEPRDTSKKVSKVSESDNKNVKKNAGQNWQGVSTRSYLEQTVVPVLMQGMSELAKERPDNALEFLGNYLIKHASD